MHEVRADYADSCVRWSSNCAGILLHCTIFRQAGFTSSNLLDTLWREHGCFGYAPYIFLTKIHMERLPDVGRQSSPKSPLDRASMRNQRFRKSAVPDDGSVVDGEVCVPRVCRLSVVVMSALRSKQGLSARVSGVALCCISEPIPGKSASTRGESDNHDDTASSLAQADRYIFCRNSSDYTKIERRQTTEALSAESLRARGVSANGFAIDSPHAPRVD